MTQTISDFLHQTFCDSVLNPKLFSIGTIDPDDTMLIRSLGMNGLNVLHCGTCWAVCD